jgi:hypothetical protein
LQAILFLPTMMNVRLLLVNPATRAKNPGPMMRPGRSSFPVMPGRALWTDDDLADGLLAGSAWIIAEALLALALLIQTEEAVGPVTGWVTPCPTGQNQTMHRGAWGHHARTELTDKHFCEPKSLLPAGSGPTGIRGLSPKNLLKEKSKPSVAGDWPRPVVEWEEGVVQPRRAVASRTSNGARSNAAGRLISGRG